MMRTQTLIERHDCLHVFRAVGAVWQCAVHIRKLHCCQQGSTTPVARMTRCERGSPSSSTASQHTPACPYSVIIAHHVTT